MSNVPNLFIMKLLPRYTKKWKENKCRKKHTDQRKHTKKIYKTPHEKTYHMVHV